MSEELIVFFGYESVLLVLWLSLPPIIVATAVGLLVALFQALTQIQEQTLGFSVKLVAVVAVLMMLMPWVGNELVGFTDRILTDFPTLTR